MQNAEKRCRTCGRIFTGGETFCPEDGGRLATRSASMDGDDPLIGAVLDGRYRVRRVVGEGGMGIVYEAEHELIERRVALKVLRDDFSRRPDVVERFRREAKSASRIGHPNIVDILDFGETPAGASYFVMEMLEGEDVADAMVRGGVLPPERAVPIVVQCCRALAAAHDKGIIHRDLKPENIFLIEREGVGDIVKIVDFGVAKMSEIEVEGSPHRKLTRTGMIFGTPEYMSPEQAQGQPPDHRVDIYAMGIILFELLTGRVPFEGESFMSVLSKHARHRVPELRDVHPTLSVSQALEAVVYRALEKAPEQRFASMGEMAEALMAVPEMPELLQRTSASGSLAAPSLPPAPRSAEAGARAAEGPGERAPTHEVPTTELITPLTTQVQLPEPEAPLPVDRRPLWWAAGAAVALAAIAGVFFAAGDDDAPAAAAAGEPATVEAPAPVVPPTAPGEREPGPAVEAAPALAQADADRDEGAAQELVRVAVTTRPRGASVHMVGGGKLCERTPCSFEVVRGEPIALLARSGNRKARRRIEPDADTKLHLVLLGGDDAAAASTADGKGEASASAPERPRVSTAGDLKVPPAFRD